MKRLPIKKSPSTTALQCFEAAAKYMSFTKAAEELCMTQSAVSKQVAQLETLLSQKLFIRTPQYLQITPAGSQYLIAVSNILSNIEKSTLAMLAYDKTLVELRLAAHPTLCTSWLTPLLFGFGQAHPNVRLDIRDKITSEIQDEQEIFDIAFLSGNGLWAGKECIELFQEDCIVVCAPSLATTIHQVLDLTSYVFLQVRTRPTLWQQYFLDQGVEVEASFTGPKFDTFSACIQAAKFGCGLALVPKRFVAKELEEGSLVSPWHYRFVGDNAYYMIYSTADREVPKIKAMVDWVTARNL